MLRGYALYGEKRWETEVPTTGHSICSSFPCYSMTETRIDYDELTVLAFSDLFCLKRDMLRLVRFACVARGAKLWPSLN